MLYFSSKKMSSQRYDYHGKIINASDINPFDRSYNNLQHAFDSKVIELLSNVFNFTISRIKTPLITNLDAYEIIPNSWIIEQIVNGTCEISSTTMVLSPESPKTVHYSIGVGTFRPQLFYKAKSVREEYNIYFIPFSIDVWICLMGLLLVITVALAFILGRETVLPHETPYDIIARIADQKHEDGVEWNKIPEELKTTPKESLLQRERWDMGEILLVTIGALCQQGSARDPSTSAARTLLLVLFVLAVVAYTAYSASVISLISLLPATEHEQHALFKTFPENTKILLQDTNYYRHRFEIPYKNTDYSSLENGLNQAIEGKAVFIGDRDVSLTVMHRRGYGPEYRCSVSRVFLGLEYQRVFIFRNTSSYKEPINYNILRLRQFGLLDRERKKLFNVRYPCSFKERSSISGFVSVDINDIKPAIYLLSWGIISSIIMLVLEYIIFFSAKGIRRIFGKSWKKVDDKVEAILNKWYKKKNSRIKPYEGEIYELEGINGNNVRQISIFELKFLPLRSSIPPLPFNR